jgi:hypothetical protein
MNRSFVHQISEKVTRWWLDKERMRKKWRVVSPEKTQERIF